MEPNWQDSFLDNRGKIIGAVTGFLIGILIITLGFFKAFFIIVCTFLGFYFGMRRDEREEVMRIFERFIPNGSSRK